MHPSLLFVFLTPVLAAQQAGAAPSPVSRDAGRHPAMHAHASSAGGKAVPLLLNRTAGLQELDGELWGGADGYKVRFDADGFEFTPALGPAAPRNYPMTFRLEWIGRGSEPVPLAAAKQRHDGLRAENDRGSVVERYDLGPEGMEQSFVFATRPRGHGDLVVRGRLRTDMQVTHESGGLRVEQPGFGGFHVGAVTGIDAEGARAQGSIRYDDGIVELSLPAEFVDRAALPFVLDPLIGSVFGLNLITGFDDRGPLAAFDATNDCYLVIWSNVFSATDTDTHGQRLSRAGSLLGTRIFIDSSTANDTEPSVCNVNARDAFVVVFNRAGDIHGRTVSASNGFVSVGIPIASGSSDQHSPSIGGDPVNALVISGTSVCVWESDAEPAVLATRVLVNVDLSLSLSGTVHTLASGTPGRASRPRISKSGSRARFAVVFERQFANKDPWAVVVNSSGAPITAPASLDSSAADSTLPEVDGDGTNWLVAWQEQSRVVTLGCSVAGSPLSVVTTARVLLSPVAPASNMQVPSVIWTGGSALVGWGYSVLFPNAFKAAVSSLDPFHCLQCESAFIDMPELGAPGLESTPFGCSALSGGGPADDALLVWGTRIEGNADVMAIFWRAADGTVSSLGGGCGTGGTAQATCVRVPNPDFAHRLRGATPNAGTFLLQSLGQESGVCGPCTRIPALNSLVALFLVTDALGNATTPSAIPNITALRGLVQFDQWLTLRQGGACSQFDLDMSNALRIVIE